jgi:excalibur calcium-binding domain-containing protein
MPRILKLVIFAGLIWYGWSKYQEQRSAQIPATPAATVERESPIAAGLSRAEPSRFSCDGRTHCSQMKSCAEASYFIKNCPNTQMDGDNDGQPCESQWCN